MDTEDPRSIRVQIPVELSGETLRSALDSVAVGGGLLAGGPLEQANAETRPRIPAVPRNGGPLLAYDELFDPVDDQQPEVFRRLGDKVALRFPDPEPRTDAAGRLIPHRFVLSGPEADGINSLEEGRGRIWPLVAAEYAEVWNATGPPAVRE